MDTYLLQLHQKAVDLLGFDPVRVARILFVAACVGGIFSMWINDAQLWLFAILATLNFAMCVGIYAVPWFLRSFASALWYRYFVLGMLIWSAVTLNLRDTVFHTFLLSAVYFALCDKPKPRDKKSWRAIPKLT